MLDKIGETTPPCGRAAQRFVVSPVFQVPGCEHVADHSQEPVVTYLLSEDLDHYFVIQTAETVGAVSFNKPHRPGPGSFPLPERGVTAPAQPEAVRVAGERRFVVCLQQEAH